jgi:endonuclease/exonuclease/phosphatase (EEP) superfamily protein YafD
MRVATWNLKQAVAPRARPEALWAWAEEQFNPDIVVFTEAKLPAAGAPEGWNAISTDGGIGPRRRWGTIITGRGLELNELTTVKRRLRTHELTPRWPGTVQIADAIVDGERWATIVGVYGLTVDLDGNKVGHGRRSIPAILDDLEPLFSSSKGERLVLAGDFNMWPGDLPRQLDDYGLVDLIEITSENRDPLAGCSGCGLGQDCGHLWTHRNGKTANAAVQQIDYIFASAALADELTTVSGGAADFPHAWAVSDHAPVIADFG